MIYCLLQKHGTITNSALPILYAGNGPKNTYAQNVSHSQSSWPETTTNKSLVSQEKALCKLSYCPNFLAMPLSIRGFPCHGQTKTAPVLSKENH